MEQLLNAEAEVSKLKAEEPPTVKLSPEEARRAMLQKVRHLSLLMISTKI